MEQVESRVVSLCTLNKFITCHNAKGVGRKFMMKVRGIKC